MSRHAKIITVTNDCFGDSWDIREREIAADGMECVQGWPQGLPRGQGGIGGPSWVITEALAEKYKSMKPRETIPYFRDNNYPFGIWVVKKHRAILGIDRSGLAERWWLSKFEDLEALPIVGFCKKYGVSHQSVSNWRQRFSLERKLGEDYWWTSADAIAIFASDTIALTWMADHYKISVARVLAIRTALRRQGIEIKDRRT